MRVETMVDAITRVRTGVGQVRGRVFRARGLQMRVWARPGPGMAGLGRSTAGDVVRAAIRRARNVWWGGPGA